MRFKIYQILIFVCIATVSSNLFAQQGIGTETPDKSAALEIKSEKRGLLIPRVSLQSITDQTTISDGNVESLLVYNINEGDDMIPGYYYWSESENKWIKLLVEGDESGNEIETSWLEQITDDPAIENDQNIYQEGNVAIGKTENFLDATLDVFGSIRGGNPADETFGENSMAVGDGVIASGENSIALGYQSEATAGGSFAGGGYYYDASSGTGTSGYRDGGKASGKNSFAFGYQAEASGELSTAFGYKTLADTSYTFAAGRETKAVRPGAVAFGRSTRAKGNYSFVTGRNNEVTAYYGSAHGRYLLVNSSYSTAVGRGNVNFSGSLISGWNSDDPLFVIGNGENRSTTNNAMTVLKSGFVGIGLNGTGAGAKPKERVDIGDGKLRVRDLPEAVGDINEDRIVVVSTTPNNQKGILRSIDPSELKSTGPWFLQSTTNPATLNTQDIYQMGSVAIGKEKVLTANDNSSAMLDVAGAIRGGTMPGTTSFTIGENSIGVGERVIASGKYSTAFGYKSEASGAGSFAGGGDDTHPGGKASGVSSFAYGWGSEAEGDYSTAIGRNNKAIEDYAVTFGYNNIASGIYSFTLGRNNTAEKAGAVAFGRNNESQGNYSLTVGRYIVAPASYSTSIGKYNAITSGLSVGGIEDNNDDPIFQIGNGTTSSQRNNALTILKNGKIGIGIDGQENAAKPTEILDIGKASDNGKNKVRIRDLWDTPIGGEDYKNVVVNDEGILKIIDEVNPEPLPYQSSEKIEELYLYSIEQKEKIIALQREINNLKQDKEKMEKRLERLEEILNQR